MRSFILVSDVYSLSLSKYLSELLRVSFSFFLFSLSLPPSFSFLLFKVVSRWRWVVWFRSDFYFSEFEFFLCSGVWIIPSPTMKVFSNGGRGRDDEFLTNVFSLCTQMAICFSYFDLLMWWIILIDFLILNHPRRNPFCSWCFIIFIHPESILKCFVSIFIGEIVLQFYF